MIISPRSNIFSSEVSNDYAIDDGPSFAVEFRLFMIRDIAKDFIHMNGRPWFVGRQATQKSPTSAVRLSF